MQHQQADKPGKIFNMANLSATVFSFSPIFYKLSMHIKATKRKINGQIICKKPED
jgi:hypothetical protein